MKNFPFPSQISKFILNSLRTEGNSYEQWMKKFIKPKEYFFLKNIMKSLTDNNKIYSYIQNLMLLKGINFSLLELEGLMQKHNKLCFLIMFYRCGLGFGNSGHNPEWISYLVKSTFIVRLDRSNLFSTISLDMLDITDSNSNINVCLPVCPDYSYQSLPGNKYRYTFDTIGSGIGLVASKALDNARALELLFKDSPLILNRLNIIILVGDFEAKPDNLDRFSITYNEFMIRIMGSVNSIMKQTGYKAITFTSLCGGFDNWMNFENATKIRYMINSYESLDRQFPHINHEKNLISRIPLYTKWFKNKESCNFKDIFFDQVVEYISMGQLVLSFYGITAVIMASDHRAMRNYYNPLNTIPIIGTSNEY